MSANSRMASRVTDSNAKWFTLAAACLALFMAVLDNLVVNVAMPTISQDLSASPAQLQWIISAYTLVFASLQITAGGMGDRFGRKKFFLFGVALFTVTSAIAALTNSIEMLIIMRAAQAVGAAFIMPLSLSLISNAFPPEERGKALGIWSAISMSGLAIGPIVGGFIVEYWSWHWIFLINVPIGIFAFFATSAVVRESHDTSGTVATDIPGTITVTAAIGFLTWALIEAGTRGWSDPMIVGSLVLSAIAFAAFIVIEQNTERPMVPLRFFRSMTFTGANIDSFFVSFLISGIAFSMTLYQQNVHGYSPVQAGLTMLPMVATMMIVAPIAGGLVNRLGSSRLIAAGLIVAGCSAFLFLRTSTDGRFIDILPAFVAMGFGMALLFGPMTTAVLNSVETEKSGIASAVNGAVRETGFAFGVALLGTIMNQTYRGSLDKDAGIQGLTDPNNASTSAFLPVIDYVREGINNAGQLVTDPNLFPGLPATISEPLRVASSDAFVDGIHRAFLIAGITTVAIALLSLRLINDRVVEMPTAVETVKPHSDRTGAPAPALGE